MALCHDVETSVTLVDPKMRWPGYPFPVKRSGAILSLIRWMPSLWICSSLPVP